MTSKAPARATAHSQFIHHPSGCTTHVIVDDFTDPWLPESSRETILLQGGFGRHWAFFYHWVPALSRNYRVIRRDLLGHGLSQAPSTSENPSAYTLDSILADIIDTLDQLKVKKIHFFGESTSGMLGEILAAREPDRVASLTICSAPSHLPSGTCEFLAMGEESWPEALRKLGSRGWAERLRAKPGTMTGDDEAYRDWWLEQVALNDSEGLARYAEFLSTLDARPWLERIVGVPTLILAPTRSAATSVEEQRHIQGRIAGAKLVEIDGRGHEIYVDAAEKCQKSYLEFLKSL